MVRPAIVYLLNCHGSPDHARRLFAALYSPRDLFFIHVDRKAPAALAEMAGMLAAAYGNVHLVERQWTVWGGYSQVDLLLRVISRCLSFSATWSHLIVLSEQHLPLWPSDTIAARLQPGVSFIEATKVSDLYEGGRVDVHHRFAMQYRELPGVGAFVSGEAVPSEGFLERLHHGSNWAVLARDACERLASLRATPDLLALFRNSLIPEETLVPTLLVGTDLGKGLTIHRQSATLMAYPHLGGAADCTFTEAAFFAAMAAGYLFICKQPFVFPAAVDVLLQSRTGMTEAGLQAVLKRLEGRTRAEAEVGPVPLDIEAFAGYVAHRVHERVPDLGWTRIDPSAFANVPKVYLVFQRPAWAQQVLVGVVSEDIRNFKVILSWHAHSRNELVPLTVGGYPTTVVRAPVHWLAFSREVFVRDDPAQGFVTVEAARDWDKVVESVCLRLRHADAFGAALQAHAPRPEPAQESGL